LEVGYLPCRRRQVHTTEDHSTFDFLCKDEKGISSELVTNVQQQGGVRDIVDNVKLAELYSWDMLWRNQVQVLCTLYYDLTKPDPEKLRVMKAFAKQVLYCFNLFTPLTVGVILHFGFEGFVVGPNCSVEHLERSFSCFGCERWKT
jgi:hypothetical protein